MTAYREIMAGPSDEVLKEATTRSTMASQGNGAVAATGAAIAGRGAPGGSEAS